MAKRENVWLKFSHLLPPESVWRRIGNPVPVKDGYAFIVATTVLNSPVMMGGTVYVIMRYDEAHDTLIRAGDKPMRYRDNKRARDALIQYRAKEA